MIEKLLTSGYAFWGSLAAVAVVLCVIYGACNFSYTDYSSRWGRFLLRHNFRASGKIFLWAFFLALGGAVIYSFVNDHELDGQKGMTFWSLLGVSLLILLVGILSQVLNYFRWCWGKMPLARIPIVILAFGVGYGAYLFWTHPGIPDGAISSALIKAITLKLKNEDMLWRENFVLSDFQTYVSLFRASDRWRTVFHWFGWICVVHLLLCNAWMHCRGWFKRILAPVLSCLIALTVVPVALVLGFGGCVLALQALVVVVYGAVGLFMLWIGLTFFWVGLEEQMSTSSSGSYSSGSWSCGGGSSYSPGVGSSSGQGEVITTYTDENGCDYKGKGESPDTVEKQSPGDFATFDKSLDGTKYKERFGDREVEIPWWMR